MRKKWLSLTLVWSMLCSIFAMPAQTAAAEISDEDLEDIIAIHTYLLGLLSGAEAADINEDGCINAVDLTLAKRYLMGYVPPALKPLRADTWDIYLNEEKTVTFTVQTASITDPVTLYDEAGNIIAEMNDNGENGDEMPGDGIYTARALLSSDEMKNAEFYAAAGELRSEPFEICFYRDLEDEEIEGFFSLFGQVSEMTFEEAAEFISQSDEISDFTLDEEQKQIWYQSVYGIQGCFMEPQESEFQTLGSGTHIGINEKNYDYDAAVDAIACNTFTPAHPDKKDVIVLRPFQEDKQDGNSLPYPAFSQIGGLLAVALGGTLTDVYDQDVTLEQLRNLDSYGSVFLNTHGEAFVRYDKTQICLLTGEIIECGGNLEIIAPFSSSDKEMHRRYSADLYSGRILCISFGIDSRIAVNERFFDRYYEPGSLDQSFWYLGACNSLKDNSLADVLLSKGAGAVVGYSDVTSTIYCYQTFVDSVLNSMVLSSENVKTAVSKAKENFGWSDPKNPPSEMRYRGRPHFRLVENNGDEAGSANVYTYNGHDYQVFFTPVKWSVAKTYCEMNNGHLATITSDGEQEFIERIIKYYNLSDFYWLGATDDEEEGIWKWVTGEEFTYNNWSEGNPNNFDHGEYGLEHYLGITGKGYFFAEPFQWNDYADATYDGVLDYKTGFICEWE